MVIQLNFIFCVCSVALRKKSGELFFFSFLQQIQDGRRFTCYSEELDSDITFSGGLHGNLEAVLYFSIINVLCGAGGDANFALRQI